jgi:hypothetical protein
MKAPPPASRAEARRSLGPHLIYAQFLSLISAPSYLGESTHLQPGPLPAGALLMEMGGGELTNSIMLLYLRTDIKVRRLGVR